MLTKPNKPDAATPAIAVKLQDALALHQRGLLDQAEALYREILHSHPRHYGALQLLATLAAQRQNFAVAVELFDQALEINPDDPILLNNRGYALRNLNRLEEALASYDRALGIKPDHAEALNNRGLVLSDLGRPEEALESYDRALGIEPDYAKALCNRGYALRNLKRPVEALESYERALKIKPDYAEAANSRGNALCDLNRREEALASYERALQIKPDYAEALNNRGNVLDSFKRSAEALESYDRALRIQPDHAEVLNNRGNALRALKRPEEAIASYDRALTIKPDYAEALNNRGNALHDLKRAEAALESYNRALGIIPDYADALYNRGKALDDLNRPEEALESYRQALKIQPDHAEALNNQGNVLRDLNLLEKAMESYERALKTRPDLVEALNNRGSVLRDLKRREEALESFERALKIKPDYAEALNNRGNALCDLNRPVEALESYERALRIMPYYAEAHSGRGNALSVLNRLEEALVSYDSALGLKPDYAEALNNRGNVLDSLKRHEQALESYDHALRIKPNFEFVYGTWLHTKMKLCDWSDLASQLALLADKLAGDEKTSPPFPVLALSGDLALQKKVAEIWAREKYPASHTLPELTRYPKHDKIRIGYFSADLHNHATAYLMAELFERHDKSKFELTAFSFGPDKNDEMRSRLAAAFDNFIDVSKQSDQEVALLSRKLEIDLAIDLKGYTRDCRTGIFALRAAPIQVNYLGYPGTMGAEYIDYLIADATLIPAAHRHEYSEKIVYLPDSYQVNDSKRRISDQAFTREELGLPPTGIVFCCFNNNFKITPDTFDSWMRILKQVEGSVLWLFEDYAAVADNLRREAVVRGVAAERLIFARRMELPEHLARHRLADLFLDTLPYNAHTTASDALWTGLPVLTCLGESFAGRVAGSLLEAIHLPELITTTPQAYEALAIELATQPERLKEIKARLAENRLTTPLFDIQRFARHIEAAYAQMYERHQAGLAPAHIHIAPSIS